MTQSTTADNEGVLDVHQQPSVIDWSPDKLDDRSGDYCEQLVSVYEYVVVLMLLKGRGKEIDHVGGTTQRFSRIDLTKRGVCRFGTGEGKARKGREGKAWEGQGRTRPGPPGLCDRRPSGILGTP